MAKRGLKMIIDILMCALSGCSAVFGILDFLMGGATHTAEWYLKAIFAILFAHYLWNITKR